ncbi:hypothetical protein [Actinoplanes sichuanensis]|uniref:PknH-like extracellular domain-containing protein n=1 Tax=Actinoplanes sichuanensis TaxID=512349 RepID=A0ABW4AK88_9ACTN|nr:hypothetical protein [Actinoplanes sichuanensis]
MNRYVSSLIAGLFGAAVAISPAQAAPRPVPEAVMLQPADLGGVQPGPVEPDLIHPLLPQPCADAPVPQPIAQRSLAADYDPRHRVYENVGRYRPGGAQDYLATLKDQLARCRAGGGDTGFRGIAEDTAGPNTVLFIRQYDEGDRWAAYLVAAVGRYVVVVLVTDPVVGAGDYTIVNDFGRAAIDRVRAS